MSDPYNSVGELCLWPNFAGFIRDMQEQYGREMGRAADRLLNPGYDPYNSVLGARIIWRCTIDSRPHPFHPQRYLKE
jgi:hypothetical protein